MATSNKPGHRGIAHVFHACRYSLKGLWAAYLHEEAFRLELLAMVVMIPLGLWLGGNGAERALLVGSLFLVPLAELVNSAVEAVVDRFGETPHPLSGRAKDLGSAAVFVTLIIVAVVWVLVLWPRLLG
ncbi:diacylglycerol kinase [Arhodomonas sp. SL1]|uniref:diacylglycerol kinase n=1 Tax=Arhodomonas sp. SL1 TaxID=3425691 RepID=UPI003F884702